MENAWKNQEAAQLVSITFADRKRMGRGVNYQLGLLWSSLPGKRELKKKTRLKSLCFKLTFNRHMLPMCLFNTLFFMGTLLEHLAEEILCACVRDFRVNKNAPFFFLNSVCSSAACFCHSFGCNLSLEVTILALLN